LVVSALSGEPKQTVLATAQIDDIRFASSQDRATIRHDWVCEFITANLLGDEEEFTVDGEYPFDCVSSHQLCKARIAWP
jgi:hypothetical protein